MHGLYFPGLRSGRNCNEWLRLRVKVENVKNFKKKLNEVNCMMQMHIPIHIFLSLTFHVASNVGGRGKCT